MSNIINISSVTGLSVAVQLYSGSIASGSTISATEIASTGEYIAIIPNTIPYGKYLALAMVGSDTKIASGELFWDGEKEINATMYEEIYRLEGLSVGKPMRVTQNSRTAGDISLVISGNGIDESIVTR